MRVGTVNVTECCEHVQIILFIFFRIRWFKLSLFTLPVDIFSSLKRLNPLRILFSLAIYKTIPSNL